MRSRADLALIVLDHAHSLLANNVRGLTIEDALEAAGGYRSVLGLLKHIGGWSRVYHSYAFESAPKHWRDTDWPRGLGDTIDPSQAYLDELIAWIEDSHARWTASIRGLPDEAFDEPRRCHWGATAPLVDIVVMIASHTTYHAGELNEVLSIVRGEAWEYSEEVEENHISTAGHRMRPVWMSEEQVQAFEAYMAKRDRDLHGA
jgi:hypothetical protein